MLRLALASAGLDRVDAEDRDMIGPLGLVLRSVPVWRVFGVSVAHRLAPGCLGCHARPIAVDRE
jgi:hypothetical protein